MGDVEECVFIGGFDSLVGTDQRGAISGKLIDGRPGVRCQGADANEPRAIPAIRTECHGLETPRFPR